MADTCWKRCGEAEWDYVSMVHRCPHREHGSQSALVPVVGALLIEDREAAAERIARLVNFTDYNGNRDASACLEFGRRALHAVAGEG